MTDWQNHTAATWGCPLCISEGCTTNTHLLGWTQIHKVKLLSATVICAGKHNPGCSSPPPLKSFWDWLPWHSVALSQLFAQPFCTPCFVWAWFTTNPVLWPTHFSPVSVFNLQYLKADSNCKQPKRYLSLASKHNEVSFFQHGFHWGVNEKKMAFQDNMYWVHLRTVQQLWETNTYIIEKKNLFPAQSQTYCFYSLSSKTVPTITAFAIFPVICVLGIPHWWEAPEMPALPTTQGYCQELLLNRDPPWAFQAALTPTAAPSWLCCTNCLLLSWQMGNCLSQFIKAKKQLKTQHKIVPLLEGLLWITSCAYI